MRMRVIMLAFVVFIFTAANVSAQDYDHTVDVKDMSFSWKIAGSDLNIKISGKSNGWVGIGFNPTDQMEGANYILGYVKGGKAKLSDDYGDSKRGHKNDEKLGGTTDVKLIGGEEKGKVTTLEFSIPLNSGDKYDSVLDVNGTTVVLLSYGGKRDSFKAKHKFRSVVKVNLSTGKVL